MGLETGEEEKNAAAAQSAAPAPCCPCLIAPRWRVLPVQSADAKGCDGRIEDRLLFP